MRKLLFLDLETTGLKPNLCSVLEVAALVVDSGSFRTLDSYEAVVFYPAIKILPEMDDWCIRTHQDSGLLDDVDRSPLTALQVDENLSYFIGKHFKTKTELCGNSVHFDLYFLNYHMPRSAALLSHRVRDVSGMARTLREVCGADLPFPPGQAQHRARPDVLWSVDQMRLIKEYISAG